MARLTLIPKRQMNRTVAHQRVVRDRLYVVAQQVAANAEFNHAPFIDPNNNHVTEFSVTRGDVDSFANMDHRAAIPYEFGWVTKKGTVVPGHYTLTRAAMGI